MARGAHETLGDRILGGLVITKRGSSEPLPWPMLESGHPMPDEASLKAGEKLIEFAKSIPQDAQVLVLLSGGASALVEALPAGLGLTQLRELNRWLLGAGLDIHAMNAIRKRISLLKGGRLAQLLYPRKVLCLAISDVSGDDPRSIGSGPLVAEPEADIPRYRLAHRNGCAPRCSRRHRCRARTTPVFETSSFRSSPGSTMPGARRRRPSGSSDMK